MPILLHAIKLELPWIIILVTVAFASPRLGARWFLRAERLLGRLSALPKRAVILCGTSAFLAAAGFTLLVGLPLPGVADEFSYLLAADTFAHGKLTNPAHPLWPFFETLHVIVRPTYMSKFPLGQGMALALGQVLTGYPIVGEWICAGLAAAAICWMLYAWLPPRYAVLGGLVTAIHPLFLEWGHNYWGGLVALLGGALATGGFRCIVDRADTIDGWMMGLGIAILGFSRPYEGFELSVMLLAAITWFFWTRPVVPAKLWIWRCVTPIVISVALFAVVTMTYNWTVTGSAVLLPYTVHEQQYDPAPVFLWRPIRTVAPYHHAEIRSYYENYVLPHFLEQRTLRGAVRAYTDKMGNIIVRYVFPLSMLVFLVPLPCAVGRDRWILLSLLILGVFFLTLFVNVSIFPHYAAPFAPIGLFVLLQGMRGLRSWRRKNRPVGRTIARLVIVTCFVGAIASIAAQVRNRYTESDSAWYVQRARIQDRLRRVPGDNLVLVRYTTRHNIHAEWVYNEADIDRSRVVWAHEMDEQSNQTLFRYYRSRRIWLLLADSRPPKLIPYPETGPSRVDFTAPGSPRK